MTVKKIVSGMILMLCFVGWSLAQPVEPADEKEFSAWVKEQAFQKAYEYARSISCETSANQKDLIALVPYEKARDFDNRYKAKYALIWHGDIGCWGGTGSWGPRIAIVRIRTGDSVVVEPEASSPMIKFKTRVRHVDSIMAYTENELTLSGLGWGPDDAHCCPSVPVRMRLREDGKGNWKLVEETPISQQTSK